MMSDWNAVIEPMLKNTPWWVYLIFCLLVAKGIKSSRPQLISLKRLCLLPLLLLVLSIYVILALVSPSMGSIGFWFFWACIGGVGGYMQIQRQHLLFDKKRHLVQTSGTWSILILILLIFFSKYYFDYTLAMDPQTIHHVVFRSALLGFTGLFNGLLFGRFTGYFLKMQQSKHIDLN